MEGGKEGGGWEGGRKEGNDRRTDGRTEAGKENLGVILMLVYAGKARCRAGARASRLS